MKAFVPILCILAATVHASISRAETLGHGDGLTNLAAMLQQRKDAESSRSSLTLEEVERIALAVNPAIQVAARRVAITEAHVPEAGALDDPSVMYRGWSIPLSQPWNFNQAQNMFSFGQAFPGRGKRALRGRVAQAGVAAAKADLDQVRLEVKVRVRKAFDDLLLTQEEMRIHDEHVGIARQAIEAARIQYAAGRIPQQDILKAQVALMQLTEHMIRFEQDAELARARLNTLLKRDPDSPLSVAGSLESSVQLPSLSQLQDVALQSRPDLVAARVAVEQSHTEQELARKSYLPDFAISAGYMLMPPGSNTRNNYMIEGQMNLPWLNRRKHDAEIAESQSKVTAQDAEMTALQNAALGEIQEALVEAKAAQRLVHLYHDDLRPQAESTLQASLIAYANNKADFLELLDSQMTLIDIDLKWLQSSEEFSKRLADLELAVGAPIAHTETPAAEVKP